MGYNLTDYSKRTKEFLHNFLCVFVYPDTFI